MRGQVAIMAVVGFFAGFFLFALLVVSLGLPEALHSFSLFSSESALRNKGYGWAFGAMLFSMLCISAWLGYRFATMREHSKSVSHLHKNLLNAQNSINKWTEINADLLWTQNLEGVFISCSPAFATHVGLSIRNIIGSKNSALLGTTNVDILSKYHQSILMGISHSSVDIVSISAQDGKDRIFEVIKTEVLDDKGHLVAVQSVARDVTLRRQQEQQLKYALESLRMLQTCVSQLNDVILISEAEPVDMPGPRIVYVNPAFERMTGYSSFDVIGKTPRLLQGPRTQLKEIARIRKALKAWKSVRAELINYTKSGREFWVELNISPVADEAGYFTHWISVQREITDRKLPE
jgi:PAS domain S-box-containing protein